MENDFVMVSAGTANAMADTANLCAKQYLKDINDRIILEAKKGNKSTNFWVEYIHKKEDIDMEQLMDVIRNTLEKNHYKCRIGSTDNGCSISCFINWA